MNNINANICLEYGVTDEDIRNSKGVWICLDPKSPNFNTNLNSIPNTSMSDVLLLKQNPLPFNDYLQLIETLLKTIDNEESYEIMIPWHIFTKLCQSIFYHLLTKAINVTLIIPLTFINETVFSSILDNTGIISIKKLGDIPETKYMLGVKM